MIKPFENNFPQVPPTTYVDETALIIGQVTLGADSSIWPMAVLRGDIQQIRIGDRTSIQDGSVIHVTHAGRFNAQGFPTHVGNDVIVGHRVVLHGCTLKDHCLIGMGAIVMDGAIVHSNVIVGAGSVVPPHRELEEGCLWLGNPARKIRKITEEEYEFLRYSAEYYVQLKNRYFA